MTYFSFKEGTWSSKNFCHLLPGLMTNSGTCNEGEGAEYELQFLIKTDNEFH